MVSRSLLRQLDSVSDDIEADLNAAFSATENWLQLDGLGVADEKIVSGKARKVTAESVWVDIGFKSEGIIELREWYDDATGQIIPPKPGDTFDVLIEAIDDGTGTMILSYRKAKRQKAWEQVIATTHEGDVVSGPVTRKIKGGLLVNIGVNVFLPASQIDVRRPSDIGEYVGKIVECKIIIVDHERRNIVVSRRRLMEDQRKELKATVMEKIQPGQILPGVVKNLAAFGAFVDIGGIDGLLHITDMAWHRVERPEDIVRVDDKIDVYVIKVDKNTEKISLGLKQKSDSPWKGVVERYPVGSRHTGEVANVMTYGAFVRLEPGIEGLVHISEMSWTKRISHPKELVKAGEQIEVQILDVNEAKHEISLGIKQIQSNPWDGVATKYPPGAIVEGTVHHLTNYGAFVEIEDGIDGLLHVSDMSWGRKNVEAGDAVVAGQKIRCVILDVDPARRRIGLGLKQLVTDPWATDIADRYPTDAWKSGKVTKVTNFGIFVELEPGLEGLLHSSELKEVDASGTVLKPEPGDSIDVRILGIDIEKRKIPLSTKPAADLATVVPDAEKPSTLRGGVGGGDLFGNLSSS